MESEHGLSRATQAAILVTGVLQGIIFFLISKYAGGFTANSWQVIVLPATMTVSVIFAFSVGSLRQWILWASLAIVFLAVLGMGVALQSNIKGLDTWEVRDWVMVFSFHLLVMQILVLPWLQRAIWPKAGESFYVHFYRICWHNCLTLLLILFTTGLFWLMMFLWGELFELVGIRWFSHLYFESVWFPAIATGLVASLTLILARSQAGLIKAIQKLFILVALGLLPLVAVLSLLFLAVLPFVGLEAVSQRTSAAGLMTSLAFIFLLLVTMAEDPQRPESGYLNRLRRLIWAATFVLPVYPLLAVWALWLRVEQYSWSPERLYGLLIISVALLWALGRWGSLLKRNNAQSIKGKVTSGIGLLCLGLLILLHTPVLDVWRISVNSHMARYHAGIIKADQVSIYMLSNAGYRGRQALQTLRQDAVFMADSSRSREVNSRLLSPKDYALPVSPQELQSHVALAPNSPKPDLALWKVLGSDRYRMAGCLSGHDNCMLTNLDLNHDGKSEWVLWLFADRTIFVYGQDREGWTMLGQGRQFPQGLTREELLNALKQQKVTALQPQWDDISLFSERIQIDYQNGW